jgi:hypothetical protein
MQKMKKHLVSAGGSLTLAALLSAGFAGAQTATPADNSQATNTPAASPANTQTKQIQMVPTLATLDKTLDAKKVKQGDPVTARLQMDTKVGDQSLPKNAELSGHVDSVQASDHKSDSSIVVTFDKVQVKGGQEIPVKATVVAIAQPANMMQQQSSSGGASPAPMQSAPAPSGNAGPSGSSGSAATTSAPTAPAMSSDPAPSSSGTQQPQQNGVPGVAVKSSIHDSNSATFTSQGKNVRLDDGTRMEVAVAIIPAGVKIQ